MTCGHCVGAVQKLINEVDGVKSFEISLPDNLTVVFDETKAKLEDFKKIINDSDIYKVL